MASGTTVVTVPATDPSGNAPTRQYEVDSLGSSRTFTFDPNGNLTSDGTRTFEWDARNQIISVTVGGYRSEYTYDGKMRRVRVVEQVSGTTQSDTKIVWCQMTACEERSVTGPAVTTSLLALGEQTNGTSIFFAIDHLTSVRGVINGAGSALTQYEFDPWDEPRSLRVSIPRALVLPGTVAPHQPQRSGSVSIAVTMPIRDAGSARTQRVQWTDPICTHMFETTPRGSMIPQA